MSDAPPDRAAERGRRRFVAAIMLNPYALPVAGIALFVAVIGGIHLGNSAVAGINPLYYQGPAVHPRDRGAMVSESAPAAGLSRRLPSYDQLYGWDEGRAARAAATFCEGCEAVPVYSEAYRAGVPYFGSREEARVVAAHESAAADALYEKRLEEAELRRARLDLIERYAAGPLENEAAAPEEIPIEPAGEFQPAEASELVASTAFE